MMSKEDFDGGYSEWARERHKKRVAKRGIHALIGLLDDVGKEDEGK
jgi:hypothetical protein